MPPARPTAPQSGVSFSALRAEFTRQNGALTIRDGVVKGPMIGATIEGSIDYPGNQVCMSGTFVPMYGVNNIFGQIPLFGMFLGGGNKEGLIGVTYEVVGTPAAPVMRVNPISAMVPGVFRKIFEFNTGKQNTPFEEFPSADRATARPERRASSRAAAPSRGDSARLPSREKLARCQPRDARLPRPR